MDVEIIQIKPNIIINNVFCFRFLLFFIFILSISHLLSHESIRKPKSVSENVSCFDHFKQTKTTHPVNDRVRHYMMSGIMSQLHGREKSHFLLSCFNFQS